MDSLARFGGIACSLRFSNRAEDIEAAIDRAMVEGYTRVPDDEDAWDPVYEDLARRSIAEEPW